MLHPIKHDNRSALWCGPAAMAAITGHPTSLIHGMLRNASGRKAITFAYDSDVTGAMRSLGYEVEHFEEYNGERMSVCEFSRHKAELLRDHALLVQVHGHYVVLYRDLFIDSQHPKPIPPGESAYADTKVAAYWAFVKTGPAVIPDGLVKRWTDDTTKEALRIARKYRIKVARETWDGLKYVLSCPAEVDDVDDIYEGDWEAETPLELLRKVKQYAELVEHVRVHGCLC